MIWHIVIVVKSGPEAIKWFLIIPLVMILGVGGWFEFRWWSGVNAGSALVKYASGNEEASLDCQRLEEILVDVKPFLKGFVNLETPEVAHMKYEECNFLMDWFRSDKKNPTSDQAYALHVLTHESMHVAGIMNEAETECAAIRNFVDVAEKSDASYEVAKKMQAMYLHDWWPRLPGSYKSSCEPVG